MTYTLDTIIDFGALATAITPMLVAALGGAVVIGASIFVAKRGWAIFKGMAK